MNEDIESIYQCRHCHMTFYTLEKAETHAKTCRLLHEMTLYMLHLVWKFRPSESPYISVKEIFCSRDQYETILGKVDSYIYNGEFSCTLHTTDDYPETIAQFKEFCKSEMRRLLDEKKKIVDSADFSWCPANRV